MMKAEDLKNSVLQMAMQGKLVPQDPEDEPASMLLEKIKEEKEQLIKDKKIKRDNKESTIYKKDGHWYEKIGKKGETNCIDEKIPYHIPENWNWCSLENVMNIVSSRRVHQSDWKKEGIPFYRAREIGALADKGFVNNDLYISEKLFDEFKDYGIPEPDDLMVTGVGTLGKTYIVKQEDLFYYKDASVLCFKNFSKLNPFFLKFLMHSSFMKNQIKQSSSGTTVATITMKKAKKYLIPLPPLNEQKRIVEKLEQILPKIEQYAKYEEELTKLNKELPEKLKKSILQQAIQGKLVPQNPEEEPATKLLEKIKQEKEQLIKDKKIKRNKNESTIYKKDGHWYEVIDGYNEVKCIDEEIPFDIPDNWCWCRLTNISSINPRNQLNDEINVSFIPMSYIDEGYNNSYKYEIKKWSEIKKGYTHFSQEDIALAKITPCFQNRKSLIFENLKNGFGAGTTELHIVRPILVYNKYLLLFFKTEYFIAKGVNNFTGTAGQQRINKTFLENILVPIPPFNEEKKVVKKVNELFKIII